MAADAKFKSMFILPAAGVTLLLLLFSLFQAFVSNYERIAWLGAAIACLPLLLIMARLMTKPVVRTSENLPLLLLVMAIGAGIAAWEQFVEETSGWGPTSVALAGSLIMLAYVFWYSRFNRIESYQLTVGNKLPQFELKDSTGQSLRTQDLIGSPSVLLFYRGNWCPLCMAQVAEIAERYQDMASLGITVALISPQPQEETEKLAAKFEVPFRFLVDEGNKVAEELGIAVRNGVPLGVPGDYSPDTVMPTVLVANANGTIIFSDQTDNYRVRPEPDIFLAIIRRAEAMAA